MKMNCALGLLLLVIVSTSLVSDVRCAGCPACLAVVCPQQDCPCGSTNNPCACCPTCNSCVQK
uniref:U7-Austrotoxin-Ht1a_1 n=2 Tax=Hickmania troglodytes TaxID=489260 RepID=A0A482Z5Q0_9ARAC